MKQTYTILAIGVIILAILGFFAFAPSQRQGSTSNDTKITAAVTILPQVQIVERIGGNRVVVQAMIPAGFSHEAYEPTVAEMAYAMDVDVYFSTGHLPFEQTQLPALVAANPDMLIVDTSVNNTLRHLEAHSHEGEAEHDGEEEHEEDGDEESIDPHVWLVPRMVEQQAEIIAATLIDLDPDHAEYYSQNLEDLRAELVALDAELRTAFAPIKGKTILVYHPAFGYLADEYGLTQEYFELEGKDPTIQQMQSVISLAKAEGIDTIFVQKQFSQDSAQVIAAEIDGRVIVVDPVNPDYFGGMRAIAQAFTQRVQ